MAKPGSAQAAELSRLAQMDRNAVDLGRLPKEKEEKLLKAAELQLGLRCAGCGERVRIGYEFVKLEISMQQGQPAVGTATVAACDGIGGCTFAEDVPASGSATVVRPLELVWLDEKPAPSPADDLAARAAPPPE